MKFRILGAALLQAFKNFQELGPTCQPIQYACSENEQLGYSDPPVSNFICVSELNYQLAVMFEYGAVSKTHFPNNQRNQSAYTLEIALACTDSYLLCAV